MIKMRIGEYELRPLYDSHKSFYGKAVVEVFGGNETLYSYRTRVACIGGYGTRTVTLYREWCRSATTLRHVKEFLCQKGYGQLSVSDIRRKIGKGEFALAD